MIQARVSRFLKAPEKHGTCRGQPLHTLLLLVVIVAACQPANPKPALPTRAYRSPVAQTTLLAMSTTTSTPVSPTRTAAVADALPASATPPPASSATPAPPPSATPRLTSTLQLPPTTTPTQGREQIGEVPADGEQEPVYLPGADDTLEGWEALVAGITPPEITWKEYSGPVESSLPDSPANISFRYPGQWTLSPNTSAQRISVLSGVENTGAAQPEQLKFEILPQASRPNISSQQTGEFQEHAVEITGDPALLIVYTQDPEKQQLFSVIFQHNQAWYIAVGSIQIDQPDAARVEQLRAMLFAMFQSVRITP